jgi:aminomethyltransferase
MTRTTALNHIHQESGATFTDFAGWSMPLRYGSAVEEHNAVRSAAGLFDLSHMGEIEVAGPQAGEALDYALVGRASKIGVGRARYTMICQQDGGIIDDLVVYRLDVDRFMVVANAGNVGVVLEEVRSRATGFDAVVLDRSDDWSLLAVQGPASVAILRRLADPDVEGLRYYAITAATIDGKDVLLARTGYTGEDGFEIYCRPADATTLWTALVHEGSHHGLVPAGLGCRDTLRLEAGMPLYGQELTRSTTPFEAGLGRIVAADKEADYVGRAALEQCREVGPAQVLVGLVSEGRRSPRTGYAIADASGAPVGVVTSGAPSPTLGRPIALAYVTARLSAPGTHLLVNIRGTHEPVAVVTLPFYRRPE